MTTTKELLISARKIIEHPQNWTRGTLARDGQASGCSPYSPTAVCFCSIGALHRAVMRDLDESFDNPLDNLSKSTKLLSHCAGVANIVDFNDTVTHQEVLVVFDRAIELAE